MVGAGEGSKLPVKGLFYGIGHQPNSQLVAGQIDLDDHGYVKVLVTPLTGSVHDLHSHSTWLTQTRHHVSHHALHPFITHSSHSFVMAFNVVAAPDDGYVCYLTCCEDRLPAWLQLLQHNGHLLADHSSCDNVI